MTQDPTPTPAVAYLAPPGTFTYQAALEVFGPSATYIPCTAIPDLFSTIQDLAKGCTHAVIPYENSTNGSVVPTLDLLRDLDLSNKHLRVVGEKYLRVRHTLLSNSTSLRTVKRVYSHAQAFGQCEQFLHQSLPRDIERISVSSTSRAAELAAEEGDGTAGIASEICGELFGVGVLARDIQDNDDNTTRFLIISPHPRSPYSPSPPSPTPTHHRALILVHAPLHTLLTTLPPSLTIDSIRSRPAKRGGFEYVHFVECVGDGEGDEGVVRRGVEKEGVDVLGVFGDWRGVQVGSGRGRKGVEKENGV
ncbi:prephenate dehydratase [Saitoella coloradoensis]